MFPTFPSGATLDSILIACAQAGRIPSACERRLGLYMRQRQWSTYIDLDPALVSKHVLEGAITEQDLYFHHTLAPIELSFNRSALLRREALGRTFLTRRLGYTSLLGLRSCPKCVAEDMEAFGCGHWRREHQIYTVDICTKHLTALHYQCAELDCGRKFCFGDDLLPGQPCPSCKSTQTTGKQLGPISEGYQAYCKLFTDALHIRIPEVDSDRVHDFFQLPAVFCDGNTGDFGNYLFRWLGPQWQEASFAWDTATEFMYWQPRTRHPSRLYPALLLLTAFKRRILGAPPEEESYCWSSSYASKAILRTQSGDKKWT